MASGTLNRVGMVSFPTKRFPPCGQRKLHIWNGFMSANLQAKDFLHVP